jgi:hypothetical protein
MAPSRGFPFLKIVQTNSDAHLTIYVTGTGVLSSLLSKNTKIKIYRTIILPVVLYGCETWSLTLRKEHRLRVFANRVLRRILGPKRDGVTGSGEDYITRNLMICTHLQILFG